MEIRYDPSSFLHALNELERNQLPFAGTLALTRTAEAARRFAIAEFKQRFDRPKPSTVNEKNGPIRLKTATKSKWPNDYTEIRIKDQPLPKGDPALVYLYHHLKGGQRVAKRLELNLRSAGILHKSDYAIPGAGARMDAYGNMSQGQVQEILSAFAAQKLDYMNSAITKKKGKNWIKNNPKLADYFVAYRRRNKTTHLHEGIWQRYGAKKWRVRPVLIFVRVRPRYKQRINLDEIVAGVARFRFLVELRTALKHAIATARPKPPKLARAA